MVPSVKKVVFRAFCAENRPSIERFEHGDRFVLAFHLRRKCAIVIGVPAQVFCGDELLVFSAYHKISRDIRMPQQGTTSWNERSRE